MNTARQTAAESMIIFRDAMPADLLAELDRVDEKLEYLDRKETARIEMLGDAWKYDEQIDFDRDLYFGIKRARKALDSKRDSFETSRVHDYVIEARNIRIDRDATEAYVEDLLQRLDASFRDAVIRRESIDPDISVDAYVKDIHGRDADLRKALHDAHAVGTCINGDYEWTWDDDVTVDGDVRSMIGSAETERIVGIMADLYWTDEATAMAYCLCHRPADLKNDAIFVELVRYIHALDGRYNASVAEPGYAAYDKLREEILKLADFVNNH